MRVFGRIYAFFILAQKAMAKCYDECDMIEELTNIYMSLVKLDYI